jgi:hypothetical protein
MLSLKQKYMRTFILLATCFFILESKAQGNLQFNQVLNVQYTSSASTTLTVPAGKVWKLENLVMTSLNTYACFIYNGTTYYLRQHNTSSSAWDNFPFWIGSEQTITFGAGCSSGMISIIEFNVVP